MRRTLFEAGGIRVSATCRLCHRRTLSGRQRLAAEDAAELAALRIVLVGDSTVASYSNPPADRPSLTGWGQVFDEFFSDRVTVLNHAVSGHSSKSFIREGLWQKTLEAKPDYVFIQFGHNDQPGKGERSTDVNTDYQEYLRQYVKELGRGRNRFSSPRSPAACSRTGAGHDAAAVRRCDEASRPS